MEPTTTKRRLLDGDNLKEYLGNVFVWVDTMVCRIRQNKLRKIFVYHEFHIMLTVQEETHTRLLTGEYAVHTSKANSFMPQPLDA